VIITILEKSSLFGEYFANSTKLAILKHSSIFEIGYNSFGTYFKHTQVKRGLEITMQLLIFQ